MSHVFAYDAQRHRDSSWTVAVNVRPDRDLDTDREPPTPSDLPAHVRVALTDWLGSLNDVGGDG